MKIEIPYKPVIRYAVPIFDIHGEEKGISIVNLFANSFLKGVQTTDYVGEKKTFLMYDKGFYFVHPEKEK